MAKKQIHNSTQLPLMTDEGKSVNVFDGPWDTIDVFEAWWNETTDGEALEAGTVIGVANGTNVDKYCWLVPTGSSGYWKKIDLVGDIVEFGGIVSGAIVTASVLNAEGDKSNVFYDETTNTFIIRASNLRYYTGWKNFNDYGELGDDGRIYPYDGKFYINVSTGQLFYSTSEELEPADGGGTGGLTPAQQNAVNSGITAELVEELIRLKGMNIQYSHSKDELTLTDASSAGGTQTYNLAEGGGSTSYGEPTVTLAYTSNVSNSATTLSPVISVVQMMVKGGTQTTLTYTSVNELINDTGATVSFSLIQSASGVSINSQTGVITFSENTSGSIKVVKAAVSVTNLNSTGNNGSAESNKIRQGKLYIKEIVWGQPVSDGNGGYTITPTFVASDNNTYTYAEYSAQSVLKETFSFSVDGESSLYGASLNSTTGVISYNISTMLSGLSSGDTITTSFLVCTQSNVEPLYFEAPDMFNCVNEQEYVAFDSWINNVGGDTTDDNPTTVKYRTNCSAAPSIAAEDGDVFYFKMYVDPDRNYAVHAWLLETQSAAFAPGDPAYTTGAVYDSTNVEAITHIGQAKKFVIYKVSSEDTQYLTYCGGRKALGYYKIQ